MRKPRKTERIVYKGVNFDLDSYIGKDPCNLIEMVWQSIDVAKIRGMYDLFLHREGFRTYHPWFIGGFRKETEKEKNIRLKEETKNKEKEKRESEKKKLKKEKNDYKEYKRLKKKFEKNGIALIVHSISGE
jgi:hypothetical protein